MRLMANATPAMQVLDDYRRRYEQQRERTDQPAWLRSLRDAAMAEFQRTGFPTSALEDWKYTDPSVLASTRFGTPGPSKAGQGAIAPFAIDPKAHRLVFVNGAYTPELSSLQSLPPGVKAQSLAAAIRSDGHEVERHLGQSALLENNAFTALNTALFTDGAYVFIPDGVRLERPIHVLFLGQNAGPASANQGRLLARLGANAEAHLIESHAGEGTYFQNAVTELVVGENATLHHYNLQRESAEAHHIHTIEVEQERASVYDSHNVALGARLSRTDLNVRFNAEGAECDLNGLYVGAGQQHIDLHSRVDHQRPHCTSREYYKGIMDGTSRGVFYGKVFVRKDAQKTDASQQNKNLLLSDGALVDSTPALEINADDVKAAHGSTIGQLDPDHVFYLRARGIDEATARSLLTYAFARDIIARIPLESVRNSTDGLVVARLPRGTGVYEAMR
jgi:Fe-S cluster assembly protein SufD